RAAATERGRLGHVEDAVVADVRARRDALDVLHRRVTATARLRTRAGPSCWDVSLDARDHASDERAMERLVTVERRAVRARPGEAARDDYLWRRPPWPFREARRIREPLRIEEGVLIVDAVVDDRDLHAVTARPGQRRELGCADDGRPAVEVEAVRQAGI